MAAAGASGAELDRLVGVARRAIGGAQLLHAVYSLRESSVLMSREFISMADAESLESVEHAKGPSGTNI